MSRPRDGRGDGFPEAEYQITFMGASMLVCTVHKDAFEQKLLRRGWSDYKVVLLFPDGQEATDAEGRADRRSRKSDPTPFQEN